MAAAGKSVTLTVTATGNDIVLLNSNIHQLEASGTGSRILYSRGGVSLQEEFVDEDPATAVTGILALSDCIIPVTVTETGATLYINTFDILDVNAEGTGAVVRWQLPSHVNPQSIVVDETPAAIATLMDGVVA